MSEPKIFKKSPIIEEKKPGTYYWCSCGLSANQPYCDGSHSSTDLMPVQYEIKEDRKVAWCACKHSGKKPLCDGTHRNL